jgi:hypothetical protein
MVVSSVALRPKSDYTSTTKLQTQPLVIEGAPRQETRNRQTAKKIWSWAPDGNRLTVGRKLTSTSMIGRDTQVHR